MAEEQESERTPLAVEVPAPTAWPMITALGITFLLAGLVTSLAVSAVGLILLIAGALGWAGEVMPELRHEMVRVEPATETPAPVRPAVAKLEVGVDFNRAILPLEMYPYSAGIKGGIAGGIVMAILAGAYGIAKFGSPWYPINILAATVMPSVAASSTAALATFNLEIFLLAVLIHGIVSVLVGLLYGILLPMLPRNPVLFGGVIAPLLWSGFLWASLNVINPLLNQRIDWIWFVVCQIGFGLTAGLVTARSERIRTVQHMPFAVRSQLQASGLPGREEER